MTPLATTAPRAVPTEVMDWPKLPENPYHEITAPDDVRVRGSKIHLALVAILLRDGTTPQELVREYPPLDLESVHAIIHYCRDHRELVDRYIACAERRARQQREAHRARPPSPLARRIREFKRAKKTA